MRITAAFMFAALLTDCASIDAPDAAQRPTTQEEEVESLADRPAPMTIEALRESVFDAALEYAGELDPGQSFTAYLVAYEHAGLTLHAMVAVPKVAPSDAGFPVVIANHGYVPDPRRYGITADGVDSRPGDYYRSIPELFTSRGFLTVIPDFRGHNSSGGLEYVDPQDDDSIAYYAEDVVALMSALGDIDDADLERVFMWSHSMGGPVSLRAMLATDIVTAASFWSTMSVEELGPYLSGFDVPVIIHHELGDPSTDYRNSERFNGALRGRGHPSTMHIRTGEDHYFTGDAREQAADRDAEFFRRFMPES